MRIALVAALTLTGVGTCATVSTAATAVPDGFLLYERAAIEGKGLWSINKQKGARLAINPCLNDKLGTKGRTAARTILYHRPPSDRRAEQVILYSSAKEASAALGELKNDLPRCPPFQSGPLVFRYRLPGRRHSDAQGGQVGVAPPSPWRRTARYGWRADWPPGRT
ncbi:hypothetical protein AB0K48_36030, partial [Nonomuraea sp. NPDC055795]